MGKVCTFSKEEIKDICFQYFENKESTVKLAKKYRCSPPTIAKILREDGRPIRSAAGHHTRQEADFRLEEISTRRKKGQTLQEIANTLKISVETVSEHLESLGFDKIPRIWNPDRKAIAQRVIALYRIGMHQRDIENRLNLGRGYARKLLAFSDDPDLEIRKQSWTRTRKASAIALERKGLYENGMTCKEIDNFLGNREGYTRELLIKFYPEILIPAKEQTKKSERKGLAVANKELVNAGILLSRKALRKP